MFFGSELSEHLAALALLRITVFREFFYIYDGNLDYEQSYLQTYTRSSNSLIMLVSDADRCWVLPLPYGWQKKRLKCSGRVLTPI